MQALLRDIRYGFRSLRQSPGFALIAILALTVGIALTTTMFSILYGALMKGLPFEDGKRIVMIQRANPSNGSQRMSVTIHDFADYKEQQHTLQDLAGTTSGTINVSDNSTPERYSGSWVTANAFDVLRVRPIRGRAFLPGEDKPSGAKVAVLSYEMWQERYAGMDSALGKTIRANGVPYTIVGVMPPKFAFPQSSRIWLPFQEDPIATKRGEGTQLEVYGHLKPGVSIGDASKDFAAIAGRLAKDYKQSNEHITAGAVEYVEGSMGPQPRQLLWTMLGAVFLVLLIACANVANLLLDRAAHKTKEIGVRTALGASRGAVIRQFLTEALAMSVIAAALALIVSHFAIIVFNRALVDADPPFFIDIRLHPPVVVFTMIVAILTTFLSGTIPAFQSSRTDINEILKDESRGASSRVLGAISRGLVVLEIAMSCGLLVAAGLMVKSVTQLRTMDMGFNQENVFTARFGFPEAYKDTIPQMQFYEQLEQRISAIPGVTAVSIAAALPSGDRNYDGTNFALEGKSYPTEKDYPNTRTVSVSPDFFKALEIPMHRGRLFNSGDRPTSLPVAVVSDAFVKKFFPTGDAIGHRFRAGGPTSTHPWVTIVGVVGDVFAGDPQDPKPPVIYRPMLQNHTNFVYIVARTTGAAMAPTREIRSAVTALNPDIPLYWVYSLREAVARPTWFVRVFGTMFIIFGGIALFLAAVGLYAVMSFSVSRRTREVGIRMALGAKAGDVVSMIFKQGAWQLAFGLGFGLIIAAAMAFAMSAIGIMLFNVKPWDPSVFAGVLVVLTATGFLACLVPARRATRVDPLTALRSQ